MLQPLLVLTFSDFIHLQNKKAPYKWHFFRNIYTINSLFKENFMLKHHITIVTHSVLTM
nr:MAG TPA: hypothetical protein [Caudoviricetes sp.]